MTLPVFTEIPFPKLDPVMIAIPAIPLGNIDVGPFFIRWYAMAYLGGAAASYLYVKWLSQYKELFGPMPPPSKRDLEDTSFNVLLGVLLGGRIGYILFYQIPFNTDAFLADPLMILRVWEGGMSFHGGLIGAILSLLVTARQKSMSALRLLDLTAISTPIGLFFGRIANFINAELYGRPTDMPWAMRFPHWDNSSQQWIETGMEIPVHPSQLYEAALEGLLLFTILAIAVWRWKILTRHGLAGSLFLFIYACSRIVVEQFRQPDAHIGSFPAGLTMGKILSLPMLALAVFTAVQIWRGKLVAEKK